QHAKSAGFAASGEEAVDIDEGAVEVRGDVVPVGDTGGDEDGNVVLGEEVEEVGVVRPRIVEPRHGDCVLGQRGGEAGILVEDVCAFVDIGPEERALAEFGGESGHALQMLQPKDVGRGAPSGCAACAFQLKGLIEAEMQPWAGEERGVLMEPVFENGVYFT